MRLSIFNDCTTGRVCPKRRVRYFRDWGFFHTRDVCVSADLTYQVHSAPPNRLRQRKNIWSCGWRPSSHQAVHHLPRSKASIVLDDWGPHATPIGEWCSSSRISLPTFHFISSHSFFSRFLLSISPWNSSLPDLTNHRLRTRFFVTISRSADRSISQLWLASSSSSLRGEINTFHRGLRGDRRYRRLSAFLRGVSRRISGFPCNDKAMRFRK